MTNESGSTTGYKTKTLGAKSRTIGFYQLSKGAPSGSMADYALGASSNSAVGGEMKFEVGGGRTHAGARQINRYQQPKQHKNNVQTRGSNQSRGRVIRANQEIVLCQKRLGRQWRTTIGVPVMVEAELQRNSISWQSR